MTDGAFTGQICLIYCCQDFSIDILFPCCQGELDEDGEGSETGAAGDNSKFQLSHDDPERTVDPETQARLEALLEAAGKGKFIHILCYYK